MPTQIIKLSAKERFISTLASFSILLMCATVDAKIYTWVDANGNTHYGSQKPNKVQTAKKVAVKVSRPNAADQAAATEANSSDDGAVVINADGKKATNDSEPKDDDSKKDIDAEIADLEKKQEKARLIAEKKREAELVEVKQHCATAKSRIPQVVAEANFALSELSQSGMIGKASLSKAQNDVIGILSGSSSQTIDSCVSDYLDSPKKKFEIDCINSAEKLADSLTCFKIDASWAM